MVYYEIKMIQHKYKDGSLVRPVFHVKINNGTVFSSSDEEIAKDVMYLMNKVRNDRLREAT